MPLLPFNYRDRDLLHGSVAGFGGTSQESATTSEGESKVRRGVPGRGLFFVFCIFLGGFFAGSARCAFCM